MKPLALTALLHATAPGQPIPAGDTIVVNVPAWAGTPFSTMGVCVSGIDAPETH